MYFSRYSCTTRDPLHGSPHLFCTSHKTGSNADAMRAATLAMMKFSKASRRLFRSSKASDSETEDTPSVQVTDKSSVATVHKDTDEQKYMPLLFSLCKRWAWPAVTFRCQTHPHEAHVTIRDDEGDTALHWACFGNPPLDAIEALLTACPELAAATNKQGVLPIHGEYPHCHIMKSFVLSIRNSTYYSI